MPCPAGVPTVRWAHGAAGGHGGPRRRVDRGRRHPLGAGGGLQDRQQKAGLERGLLRSGLPDAAVSVQPDPGCRRALYRRTAGGRIVSAGRPRPQTLPRGQAARAVEYQLDGLVRDEQKIFDAMDADETGKYLPLATATAHPAPTRRTSGRTAPSSAASSCIWTILLPRWASSSTAADRCRAAGGEQQQKPLHMVRLQLYLLPRDRGARACAGSSCKAL